MPWMYGLTAMLRAWVTDFQLIEFFMTPIPKSVASYYKTQESPHKELLLEMRKRILEVIPEAEETIKYSMPTFVFKGNDVVGLKANKSHVGYYPYSGSVLSKFPEMTNKYKTTKGSLHIPLGMPLLKSEVRKLIKARIAMCPLTRSEVDLSIYEAVDSEWRSIGLSAPARRGLVDGKLYRVKDLTSHSESEIAALHAVGPTAMKILKRTMNSRGLKFKR